MRLRIVSLLSLVCASALLVTGCNQSIVTTTSGTPGGNGASYIFAENFNPTTQEGTIQSFPIAHLGTATSAVTPSATTVYPGEVSSISVTSPGSQKEGLTFRFARPRAPAARVAGATALRTTEDPLPPCPLQRWRAARVPGGNIFS